MTDLGQMLRELDPVVREGNYVYVLRPGDAVEDMEWEWVEMEAQAVIVEDEGRTLVIDEELAVDNELDFDGVFGWITLRVHSSLQAVGLTAAVSAALAEADISCNVLAGYFHDHLLVPVEQVEAALTALRRLSA